MKHPLRRFLSHLTVLLVFLFQLKRGFDPSPAEPGMMSSGAMPGTAAVVVSACLSAILAALLLWVIFALWDQWKKR